MIQLFMSRSGSSVIVPLNLPASHGAMTEAYSQLEQANRTGKTEIVEIKSVIANLPSYLGGLDPDSRTQLAQLNLLSSIIAKMDSRERSIYAGALDGNSINDLNDMIRVAEQVSDYILIPNVNSDVTLGRYVAVAGQIQGDPRFPEAAWPYLDFAKIGAEYYAEHGGAYTHAGYVLLKQDAEPVREKAAKIRLDLSSSQAQASVSLPALKEELERVKKLLGIDCFAEAAITKVSFAVPNLNEYMLCISARSHRAAERINNLLIALSLMRNVPARSIQLIAKTKVQENRRRKPTPSQFPSQTLPQYGPTFKRH